MGALWTLVEGDGPIWITGSYKAVPHADSVEIQNPRALAYRLQYLTGRDVHDCSVGADVDPACATLGDAPRWEQDLHLAHILQFDRGTMLQLPDGSDTALAQK